MASVTRTTVWVDNQVLTASALNTEFNNLLNALALTNADIAGGAGIVESKITFSGSGHGHTGGADGKLISITLHRGFGFFIAGTPSVGNDLSWNPTVPQAMTAVKMWAYARTAPTGSSLSIRVYNVTQAHEVTNVSITAGSNSANTTTMTFAGLTAGDLLRIDTTAVGSTVAGADISVVLEATEP